MARYYADNGLKRSDPHYRFIGWDEIEGEVVEATTADKIGMRMPKHMQKWFREATPGQTYVTKSGGRLERIY